MRHLLSILILLLSPFILVAQSGVGSGGQTNVSGGSGGTSTSQVAGVINPTLSPYNAPLTNSCANLNVTLTSGSNTVACSTATFTAADVGKVIFASCCGGLGGQAKSTSALVVAQGVINTVVNATTVTVCTTTGACTPVNATANSANGTILYWGFKADTAIAAAITAAYAAPGPCQMFFWSGMLMVSKGFGNGTVSCIYPIGATNDTNLSFQGTGRANSIILMSPDFDFTTGAGNSCGGLNGGGITRNVCFLAQQGMERKYFGINGGGNSPAATNHPVIILDSEIDDFDFDVGLSDLAARDITMTCYQMDGSGAYPNFMEIDGCGANPILIASGTANTLINGYAADVKGQNNANDGGCMAVKSGATVNTYGMYFGPASSAGTANCINVNSGGTWYSNGDICITGAGTNCINNIGGTIHLNNFSNPTDFALTADRAIVNQTGAGGVTYVANSSLFGTVNPVLRTAGTVYLDDKTTFAGGGTNSGIAPTCTESNGLTCALVAGSQNRAGFINITGNGAATTGTITLTFAGSWGGAQVESCKLNLSDNAAGQWNARATIFPKTPIAASLTAIYDNNAAALTNATLFQLTYGCDGL